MYKNSAKSTLLKRGYISKLKACNQSFVDEVFSENLREGHPRQSPNIENHLEVFLAAIDTLKNVTSPEKPDIVQLRQEALPCTPEKRAFLKEINGTPSLSFRKEILQKQATDLRDKQDSSPILRSIKVNRGLERVKSAVEKQLEKQSLCDSFSITSEKDSPGLTMLRQTPRHPLKEKQKLLVELHNETRQNADSLNIAGGVTVWPNMGDMRLTKEELVYLTLISSILALLSFATFNIIHGTTWASIESYIQKLQFFGESHRLNTSDSTSLSNSSVIWHMDFMNLTDEIKAAFIITDTKSLHWSLCYLATYACAVTLLLYYLADNILSKNKLSPNRIKRWVCLLVVVGCWTVNAFRLFFAAYRLEQSVQHNVFMLNSYQKDLVYKSFDSSVYDRIIRYWSVEYLSASSGGVITILGLVKFCDLLHYIQYYSLPIITALCTPIVKLVLALLHVYGMIEHQML